jgi:phenylacetate-CoA ligase
LAYILHRAATRVPYYCNYWNDRRRNGDKSSWEVLANWPILTKESIRLDPKAFIADDCNIRYMFEDHTGGTTGTPLNIYQSRETVQLWYAMYEARIRRWHHVSIKDNWIILGGQMVVALEQKHPPFWVKNYGLNQLYLSTFHISRETAKQYVNIINGVKPTHWVVYPSSAAYLAQLILDQQLEVCSPKVIFTNAEPLWENQREIISKAFGCPIRRTYGMGEIALAASECQEGNMHYWPDSGVMELMDDDGLINDGNEIGQILATGLINPDMPLIRYKLGDRSKKNNNGKCQCQRSLPNMDDIEGRDSDLILTPDGRKIFWLNPIFYGLPLQEAQIIQETLNNIRIRVVPVAGFGSMDEQNIIKRVKERLGADVKVVVDLVLEIPRTKAGKFKAVISHLK